MKIALITDTHFGARNDNLVIQKHMKKFYDDVFFPYLQKTEIKTVIHLGDLVDKRKTINYVTLNNVRKNFMYRLFDEMIETHFIIGNHDTYYKNTNQINSVNELFGNTPFVQIYDGAETFNFDGTEICLLPWLCADNYEDSMKHIDKTSAKILMGHLSLVGFEMFRGVQSEHGSDSSLFRKFDKVYSGHFHYKSEKGNIYYLGSPYEMMWSDYGCEKGFHVLDTDTGELEFIKNPYTLFKKIYYNDSSELTEPSQYTDSYIKIVVEEKSNPYHFDTFVDFIYQQNPAQLSVVEDFDVIEDEEIEGDQDTMTILSNYVSSLETNLDKPRLDTMLRNLYVEAVSVE